MQLSTNWQIYSKLIIQLLGLEHFQQHRTNTPTAPLDKTWSHLYTRERARRGQCWSKTAQPACPTGGLSLNSNIHLSQCIAHNRRTVIFFVQIFKGGHFFLTPLQWVFTKMKATCSYSIFQVHWQYSEVEWVVYIETFLYDHKLISFIYPNAFKTPKVSIYTTNEHLLYSNTKYSVYL